MNSESQTNIKTNAPKAFNTSPSSQSILTSTSKEGINLIPTLSKEEIVKEERKSTLNVGSIVSLLILVIVSILIVGFNIVSKVELNNEKSVLASDESNLSKYVNEIQSSNAISSRAILYQDLESQSYSPKQVVSYFTGIASRSGSATITKLSLGDNLTFEMEGNASSLNDVSKFWYLLSNDSKVESISLKSVGNNSAGSNFSFEGKLVIQSFLSSTY